MSWTFWLTKVPPQKVQNIAFWNKNKAKQLHHFFLHMWPRVRTLMIPFPPPTEACAEIPGTFTSIPAFNSSPQKPHRTLWVFDIHHQLQPPPPPRSLSKRHNEHRILSNGRTLGQFIYTSRWRLVFSIKTLIEKKEKKAPRHLSWTGFMWQTKEQSLSKLEVQFCFKSV